MFPRGSRPKVRAGLSRQRGPLLPGQGLKPPNRNNRQVTTNRITPKNSLSNSSKNPSSKRSQQTTTTYFSVLYTKRSRKKHKSWLDGYIIVRNDRYVDLTNEDGKKIASETYKPLGGMKQGNTLEIASWQLEVQDSVKEDDYISGRLFVSPTVLDIVKATKSSSLARQKRTAFKPLRPRNEAEHPQGSLNSKPMPAHDPKGPNAFVLMSSSTQCTTGKQTIPIVLDPFLGKKMRPHQRQGVKFLYNCVQGSFFLHGDGGQGAILADEMGLGKSLQAIALIWTLLKQSPSGTSLVQKAIIVCPASLVQNWLNEVSKWLGYDRLNPVAITSGSSNYESKEGLASFVNAGVKKLMIISYEMFRTHSKQLYKSNVGLVVCDEGHRLKSSQGNKTIQALRCLPCRARVILTGTPVQNDLEEFFAVCDFVNPGCLNSLASFRQVFANPIIHSRDTNATSEVVRLGEARARELGRITSKFVLRRTSSILAKYLPPKQEVAIFCRLIEVQEASYRREAREYFDDFYNCSKFSAALSAITTLRKICCHPDLVNRGIEELDNDDEESYNLKLSDSNGKLDPQKCPKLKLSHSTKMQVALSICQSSLAVRDRLVLVSNYTSALDLLQIALETNSISYCRLDGSTPVKHRGHIVRRFNEGVSGDVFLLSAKAGGVGLNLIGANRLILFDPDWNPATDLQAMARVWRDGQKKPVFVYRLLCTGTIEEKIYQRQLFKGELQIAVDSDQCIEVSENKTSNTNEKSFLHTKEGSFSAEELRDLFQYNGDLQYCETLSVLERSQIPSMADISNKARPALLLGRFQQYRNKFERDGIEGEVLCGDDSVLDKALNGKLSSQGLVSYLFTTNNGNVKSVGGEEGSHPASHSRKEGFEGCQKRRMKSMFNSDSDSDSLTYDVLTPSVDVKKRKIVAEDKKLNTREAGDVENKPASECAPSGEVHHCDKGTDKLRRINCVDSEERWDMALDQLEEDIRDT